jgi:hypothetical protein
LARKQRVEFVWRKKPSPEAILAAQLTLLGWSEEEIQEALEEDRREREAEVRNLSEKSNAKAVRGAEATDEC